MKRLIVGLCAASLCALGPQMSAAAFTPQVSAATRALDWIQQTQLQADGSVGSDATRTEETVWGLSANHRPHATFIKTGSTNNPIDYLRANVPNEEAAAGNIAQLILAVTAAGLDPTSFGPPAAKHNLLNDLQADYNPGTGEYGLDKVFDHIMSILALRSANQVPPAKAISFLEGQQKSDGGWSFDNADAFGTDTNTTALALAALASSSSLDGCAVGKALDYLKAAQQPSGGFPSQAAYPPSDPDSDGIVIEGLLAVGEDPTGPAWTKPGNKNPLTDLLSFQQDDGSFSFPGIGPDNLLATTQPLVALASTHLPLTAAGTSFTSPTVPSCQQATSSPSPTATSSPSPSPTATTVPVLAPTGGHPTNGWPALLPLILFLLGLVAFVCGWSFATATSIVFLRWLRLPIVAAAAMLALVLANHHVHAAVMHRAALVIEHGSGSLLTRCVSFVEDSISGMQLIQRSGVEYQARQFASLGSAICQLDYEPGQVPTGCFGSGPYWQYFHRSAGGWAQSGAGASSWMLHDGDMDGWHYAAGAGQTPSNLSFNAVCLPAAPTATSVASRSAAAAVATTPPIRSATTTPSATPAPSVTAGPSIVALAPTISSPKAALANTSPVQSHRTPASNDAWLVLGGALTVMLGLVAINLRRRGP